VFDASSPEIVGFWDPLVVEQIASNLLSNATKFGGDQPVEVTLFADDDNAHLVVTDHGIGIEPEAQERIFRRFERAVPDEQYGGFGIGLWVARQAAEAHGGRIRVSSAPGAGSTFVVDLPREPQRPR
jgi:signal transduction histidine kinase